MVGITTYAITRHRLMDIRLVLKRTIVYFFAVALYLSVFLTIFSGLNKYLLDGSIPLDQIILGSAIFSFGLLFSDKIFGFINRLVSKHLFKSIYTSKQAIEKLTEKSATIIELNKLLEVVVDTLKKSLGLNCSGIFLLDPETKEYQISNISGFTVKNSNALIKNNFLIKTLAEKKKPILLQELEVINQKTDDETEGAMTKLEANLRKSKASLCLPLIFKGKLTGVIILGEKVSNEAYTKEDLELLGTLSNQAAIAIENARLYS
ncbi:unnamed protein product, partial [marine sediment metagenome]